MGSDSEDDFGDERVTDTDKTPSVKIEDAELGSVGLLNSKLKNGHGHGYNFRQSQKKGQDRMCSPTRGAVMLALVLLFFGVGYIAGFFTPYKFKQRFIHKQQKVIRESKPWHTKLSDWGKLSESLNHGTQNYLIEVSYQSLNHGTQNYLIGVSYQSLNHGTQNYLIEVSYQRV
jgi:hypothetical protein